MRQSAPRLAPVQRLRWLLLLLFVGISLPSAFLMRSTWQQLKWESIHQARRQAEELAARIDSELQRMLNIEEQRSSADYRFMRIAGQAGVSNLLERSPLAAFPVQAEFPGLMGWFQIAGDGVFSTPLLPDGQTDLSQAGLDASEWTQRTLLRERLYSVLRDNQLASGESAKENDKSRLQESTVKNKDAEGESQQLAFDQLQSRGRLGNAISRVDELKLKQNYQIAIPASPELAAAASKKDIAAERQSQTRGTRKEQNAAIEGYTLNDAVALPLAKLEAKRISIFESELDPFEFSLLGDGHALLYRKVWQSGERLVQGAVIDQAPLLDHSIAAPYRQTTLASFTELLIAWQGDVVQLVGNSATSSSANAKPATELQGELLYQQRLSAPFDEVQLLWHLRELPAAPGALLLGWTGALLAIILVGSFLLLYHLGMKQLRLGQQRQDFVAAVSHELNTPLTSIRMYAEILKAGWADTVKQQSYFEFIHAESERLSRLISNVLQLARLERSDHALEVRAISATALFDMLKSRISSQVDRAGFTLRATGESFIENDSAQVLVDPDAIVQIIINLVDNALKFAASAQPRQIDLRASLGNAQLLFSVRDYGPGIDTGQLREIFQLFHRSSNQLTRETPGTGIGLALVRQLARAHGGEVTVQNRQPGAEFCLALPLL